MEVHVRKKEKLGKHICELRQTSGSTLLKLPPNAKIHARLKRAFQKLIIVSEDHPYTEYYLRSKAAIALEKKRHSSCSHWWVIHPYSKLRFLWDKLMTIILLYFFFAVPYIKAFFCICGRQLYGQFNFIYPAYAVCTIDIFMSFITGYTSADGNVIFIDPNSIARHYTQGFFLIDLITSLPYTWFITGDLISPNSTGNFFALIAELVPLLKISRLPTLRRYIKQINLVRDYEFTSVTDITIWLSLLTILIFHWSACLSWAFPFIVLHATRTKIEYSDVYAVHSQLYKDNSLQIYIISLHMGISNLIGSNFIEFREISFSDKFIRCLLLLLGSGYTIYLIVVVLQLIESSAESKLKYQEIIRRVREYIDENDLPEDLGNKLISYYQYRFQESYFKENTIVAALPKHLKQEINIYSHHGLLETAKIFYNLPKSLVANIMAVVKPVIHLKNDVIFKSGSKGNCMYFIMSGTVAIITPMGKELGHLEDGDHFGETSLIIPEHRREVSAIASETCELLQLDRRHFNRLILPTSQLHKKLSKIVQDRLNEVNRMNKLTEEEIQQKKRKSSQFKRLLMRTGDVNLPANNE
ncbi:potassium/sodium hyperpolarization-activated cyclic nucleotide-gated channel 1-like [Chelonus insularis]|uniref:potassium/sodium hyperpolarization-activated cyclic nucleotide-gated channel 1-like n=1 Tax=Chelonus insularis TaxID=460826 RepID=UPI001589C056|nr:potassium/sodium hyperpolarization-activated cyclic nucleotide-gated channel 1-like [Chelonus insularis]